MRYTPKDALDLLTAADGNYDGSTGGILDFELPEPQFVAGFTPDGDPHDPVLPWPADEQGRPYALITVTSADRDPADPDADPTRFRLYAEPVGGPRTPTAKETPDMDEITGGGLTAEGSTRYAAPPPNLPKEKVRVKNWGVTLIGSPLGIEVWWRAGRSPQVVRSRTWTMRRRQKSEDGPSPSAESSQ